VPRLENCVVVANHASFFDVYLLPAALLTVKIIRIYSKKPSN
jgi:1-acyl-sn-glycerol-3-phosphate acyltransferase